MSDPVDASSGTAWIAGIDGRTEQERSRAGKGGFTLGGQMWKDTWRAADGTERELRREEMFMLGMLRKVKDDGKWAEVLNL